MDWTLLGCFDNYHVLTSGSRIISIGSIMIAARSAAHLKLGISHIRTRLRKTIALFDDDLNKRMHVRFCSKLPDMEAFEENVLAGPNVPWEGSLFHEAIQAAENVFVETAERQQRNAYNELKKAFCAQELKTEQTHGRAASATQ
ncbi:hypothetical protein FGB62_107g113 [Gracilaria domingensis]|nr:hypothetical protein FGB62_107g113 [Gracilaria domingensis]